MIDHLGATLLRRGAHELEVAHALLVQARGDQVEHARELREQQDPVPAIDRVAHELHAGVELGAPAGVIVVVQARVAADLAELGEFGQNLELLLLELLGLTMLHLLGDTVLVGKVKLALLALQMREDGVLDLLGQVGDHVLLDAAQHEGRDEGLEAARRVALGMLDRALEALGETLMRAQEPRHQEVEDAPELGEAVLDRRTREREPHGGRQAFGRAGDLGERVLDVLGLIEHDAGETLLRVLVDVATHEVVRGHEHLVPRRARDRHATLLLGAHDGRGVERGREAVELDHPVIDERRGAHDERGRRVAGLDAGEHVRDDLERLAQTHVVGEDAAEAQMLE